MHVESYISNGTSTIWRVKYRKPVVCICYRTLWLLVSQPTITGAQLLTQVVAVRICYLRSFTGSVSCANEEVAVTVACHKELVTGRGRSRVLITLYCTQSLTSQPSLKTVGSSNSQISSSFLHFFLARSLSSSFLLLLLPVLPITESACYLWAYADSFMFV